MNATDAINKIVDLLGLKFKAENFYSTKLIDGMTEITNNQNKEVFEIGDEIFVVKDSTLIPAPEGEHITREGLKVYVGADSVIYKLEEEKEKETDVEEIEVKIEDETKTDMMSSATLADGTKIETDEQGDFAVGQKLYVVKEDGERVPAPEGEHTTQSGITLSVDRDGIITGVKYPDESGEGSLEDMKKQMESMKQAMSEMLGLFSQFNQVKNELESVKKDFEAFKKQPDRNPVVKNSQKTNILDLKLELLKNSLR